jgi:hypothetical protein
VNTVKNAEQQGKATVSNVPTAQNAPKTVEGKIQQQETIQAVKSADKQINAETFSVSHPKSMLRITAGLRDGSLTSSDLSSLLKVVAEKKLTDDRVDEILQELLGEQ